MELRLVAHVSLIPMQVRQKLLRREPIHRVMLGSRAERPGASPIESGIVARHRTIHPTTIQFSFSSQAVATRWVMPAIASAPPPLRKSISKTAWVADCQAGAGRTMVGVYLDHNCFLLPARKRCAFKPVKTVFRSIRS